MRPFHTHINQVGRYTTLVAVFLLLAACARPVFDTAGVNLAISPGDARQGMQAEGETVLWGGLILAIENLDDSTCLEVMAYPLDASQSPDVDDEPLGRFMLVEQGFLEPLTYAEGRRISVIGRLTGEYRGRVGESDYVYPLVRGERLKLWSEGEPVRTFFHIGIGLQF